ncbi:MAG: D-amino-acid transaminase [Dehalococcoidia bacterium]|nr:MAG: D-amino-acid transaminase [Alphaproteobacteria bacterium]|tara:strand:+ start:1643 stop:2509 length:867 start_codon:yes stop_codon:yes gene_type:complete
MNRIVFLNGKYIKENEAKISIFDRGLLFADSVYEVTAVIDNKLIDFPAHIERLENSLNELEIKNIFSYDLLLKMHKKLVNKNKFSNKEGLIYMQVSRGTIERDFLIKDKDVTPNIFAFTQEKNLTDVDYKTNGLEIITRNDLRWQRKDIKTTQLLFATLIKTEAYKLGADDAWLIDGDGFVNEGTSNNAYIIDKNNKIITRNLSNKLLPGITRKTIIEVAKKLKLSIEERPFTVKEALESNEAFISSASTLIAPVTKIDKNNIGKGHIGPITEILRETYIKISKNNSI